jgi:hypothetical protein
MMITIHKLKTGCFTFLGFLSESEMLHLSGIPYTIERTPSHFSAAHLRLAYIPLSLEK